MVRQKLRAIGLIGISGIALAWTAGSFGQDNAVAPPDQQLEVGRQTYARNCAACHGETLDNGHFAPPLKGPAFLAKWGKAPLADLYDYIHRSMPPAAAGSLGDDSYDALAALLVHENGGDAGRVVKAGEMGGIALPAPPAEAKAETGVGGLSTRYPLPPGPALPDRFADYTPVTEEMLDNPAPENWLSWRRSHQGLGYSPLKQIDTGNVSELHIAWAQALPGGTNMNEPLVRDGVLYVAGYGDNVFAFDAASGRQLWRYQRRLPEGTAVSSHKTIALYGDRLFTATSDNHMVALDARSGRLVWDTPMTERPDMRTPGGPLAADGVIMQGMATQAAGGGLIVGLDAETGAKLWEFETVAKPGQPGGDSWNGEPGEQRKGGSQWTSGTYDATSGLALFGVGNSYDTGPLRDLQPGQNNDALFTNSTLAIQPRTGKLVWYFQHMKNDQYDLDWVFDRVIATIDIDGKPRRVILTSGKEGLFDALNADTGKYIKTVDMGIQNYIRSIDPVTGEKHVDPAKIPGRDKGAVFVCPHGGGGRNWSPTSFNPNTRLLFVNGRDVCMDMVPASSGPGFLTTGVNIQYSPPPNGDGNYGVLQAIDMEAGKVIWETRRRQTFDMGILTTAGGLLFTGGMDRQFLAYDQETGKELWRTGATGVPNASPITYSVDGKQYIAIVTGAGNPLANGIGDVIPETQLPSVNSSAVYVFALPDDD
ncbi:MAG: PQQ-binding-like beta-propeller repeat protein [Candidatus Andeanibacterium colombiense]|uniref:PQQ-binding-like beta-propeller repeat protein n=1 Tax=Candidatus Andeanibacterium colombiense TaxID=3121345 RepID=A0AAJ6BQJ0_9SPHN|nr:MAG: PQQ-binding-like beta-propeller repeat protein [Sphingomonadaceae bacterium]